MSPPSWSLVDALDPYILPTPSDVLLLTDVHRRPLYSSKEAAHMLCTLEDPDWPERDFTGKVVGVVTVSQAGRWYTLVACHDERTAHGIKTTIEDKIRDVGVDFVESEALVQPRGKETWTLANDLSRSVRAASASIDVFDPRQERVPTKKRPIDTPEGRTDSSDSAKNARQRVNQHEKYVTRPPGDVASDHREMASVRSSKKLEEQIERWNALQRRGEPRDAQTTGVGERGMDDDIAVRSGLSSACGVAFDYTDEDRKACFLCQRQFKNVDTLRRHAVESTLHQGNLRESEKCEDGQVRKRAATVDKAAVPSRKMKCAGFVPVGDTEEVSSAGQGPYRDRASERREVFGKEGAGKVKPFSMTSRGDESLINMQHASRAPLASAAGLGESSVGGAMLSKMGWQAGQGLGTGEKGRAGPVEAHVYASGVGLGSQRHRSTPPTVEEYGKRQGRSTHGYRPDERVDRMRERFLEEEARPKR